MEQSHASKGIGQYFSAAGQLLEQVLISQRQTMARVADLWADLIQHDHIIYTFGSGHSRYIAGELFFRAGGLAPVMIIDDPAEGKAERIEGYAINFMGKYDIQAGDSLVVVSNSGINPVPIEVALAGKEMGATVVAVTSVGYSQQAASRHSSGQRLFEAADIVLDTMVPKGDAVVGIPDLGWNVAPVSTLISVAMLNAIVAQTAQNLAAAGQRPPVLISANVPEGDAHNQKMVEQYWRRLTYYPLRQIRSG
ncbi:MAG: SIS domain-containing protein [bacterium]|nr:SIS domain-containing protein [bacterium]